MAQVATPTAVESAGQWSPVGAAAAAALSDASDATYVVTDQTSNVTRLSLPPIADPGTDVGFTLRARVKTPGGSGGILVRLIQGASTEIVRWWEPVLSPTAWQEIVRDIDPAEAALITDFADLAVEITSGMPAFTNAISFLDKPGRHPAFSHTRATVGALCQQFDGSFYPPEIGEIGSHGMRRVRNLAPNTGWAGAISKAAGESGGAPTGWQESGLTGATTVHGDGSVTFTCTNQRRFYMESTARSVVAGEVHFLAVEVVSVDAPFSTGSAIGLQQTASLNISFSTDTITEPGVYWARFDFTSAGTYQARIGVGVDTNRTGTIRFKSPRIYKARPGQMIPDPEYVSLGVVTAEMLGPEAAVNGSFDVDANWTKAANWTISGGAAHANGGSGALSQPLVPEAEQQYLIEWEIANYVSGNAYVGFIGGTNSFAPVRSANGVYREVVTAKSGNTSIYIGTGTLAADVLYVSVKRLNHHGWGIDGVRCFDTDEYGNDLRIGLGPVLTVSEVQLILGGVDNGDGTYSAPVGGSFVRFLYPLDDLIDGAEYQVSVEVLPGATGTVRGDFADGPQVTLTPGTITTFTGSRADYTSTYRFVDVSQSTSGSSTFRAPVLRRVYPVRAAGAGRNPAVTNLFTQNQNASQWIARGAATITSEDDGTIPGGYFALTGLGAVTVDDVYRTVSGFTAGQSLGAGFLLRPVSTSGTLRVSNAANGANGHYEIDLSQLPVGRWSFINAEHPAITQQDPWITGAVTSAGFQIRTTTGGPMSVDIAVPTLVQGVSYCPVVIPTGASAVAVAADASPLDPTAWGYDQDGGVWVVKHTPFCDGGYRPYAQVVLSAETDSNNRYIYYNGDGTEEKLYVADGGVIQAQPLYAASPWPAYESRTAVIRVEEDNFRLSVNGGTLKSDSGGSVPTIAALLLGGSSGSGYAGAIEALYYFAPGTITDAQLLALSAGDLPPIPELA